MIVTIHWGGSGTRIGEVTDFDDYRLACAHETADGQALAGEILSNSDLDRLGLTGAERVCAHLAVPVGKGGRINGEPDLPGRGRGE